MGVQQLFAWLQASRPLAQMNIVPPLLVGQAAAWHVTGRFSGEILVGTLLWGVMDHLYIVFANEVADQHTDGAKRTLLSGGSGVIVEQKLSSRALGNAAATAAAGLLGLSFAGAAWRPVVPAFGLAALLLLWAYSFPPLRFSFRGGGEILQGLGVGVVLPALGYYAQSGGLSQPWLWAPGFLLAASGHVLTALPDLESDQRANKRTVPVRFGELRARSISIILLIGSAALIASCTPDFAAQAQAVIGGIALLGATVLTVVLRRTSALVFAMLGSGLSLGLWIAWGLLLVTR